MKNNLYRKGSTLVLIFLFIGTGLKFEINNPPTLGWSIETVDSNGNVGWSPSIALDSDNHPHISYHDATNEVLKYAEWTGSSWSIENVNSTGYGGGFTSIALDSNDYPHISYYDGANENLKYAKWTGSSWSIENVDSTDNVGLYTSIALDSNNYPHISYFKLTGWDLKYAKWTGSSWSINTVDSAEDVGFDTSIALDSNEYPHISYNDATNDDLKYAKWTGSSWSIEVVDSDGNVGWMPSIALDSSDYPHISYLHYGTYYDLKYAEWTGSSWSIEVVDSDGNVGWYPEIALDSNEYPHISYYHQGNDDLKYAKWTGSSWSIETIDSTGEVGVYTEIALDSNDYPHISYHDSTNGDLKYAKYGANSPSVQTNAATNIGYYSATLNGQILNDGGESCQIRFRYRIYGTGTWTYPSDWHGSYNSGETFSEEISGLDSGTTYEFQAGAKNTAGETWGNTKQFTTHLPEIELTPSNYDFGNVEIGQCSSEKEFTLTNIGTGTATGTVYLTGTNSDQFIITEGSGSFTLTEGQSKSIKVKFCPTSEGSKSATLYADGDSPCNDDSSIMTGYGVTSQPQIELTPSSHDFGMIKKDECSSEKEFTLTNIGTGTATGTVYLTGTNSDQFIITEGGGSFTLTEGQSKSIKVKFCPTSDEEGLKSATLFADGNSPCNDDESSLSGNVYWESFYFIHITDPHVTTNQVDVWKEDIQKIREMNFPPYNGPPDFVLCTGDLVDKGSKAANYDSLLGYLYGEKPNFYIDSAKNIPIYFCPGNHDERWFNDFSNYHSKIGSDYRRESYKNCAIFSLNSGEDEINDLIDIGTPEGDGLANKYSNEIIKFENDVKTANEDIKLVITHHPYKKKSLYLPLNGAFLYGRDNFAEACNTYKIDMLICGHLHEVDSDSDTLKIGDHTDQVNTRSIAGKGGNYYRIIHVDPLEKDYDIDSMKPFSSILSGDIFSCSMENSMTTVDIIDEQGNHNGPIDRGEIETQIPMSTYSFWELQNDTLGINTTFTEFMLDKNDSKNYTIKINGLSDDNMNVTFFTSLIGGEWIEAKYVNVTMYNGSIATVYANESILNYSMVIVDLDRTTRVVSPSSIEENLPPELINLTVGPTVVSPGEVCDYSITAIDPNDDDVYYCFDWGDGTNSSWLGPYNSNETCISNHSWKMNGTYEIKVKTKDDYSLEGNWSEVLTVNVITIVDWWPMFHHDLQHTGFSTSTAPETNSTLWTFPTGEDVFSSPAIYNDKVYIGSWDSKLYCLNSSNGYHIWNTTINFLSLSSPAIYNDKVYIGGLRLYCLNASTGEILFNSSEGYFFESSPSIAYGNVYIATEQDGKVFCFNADNLTHIWNYTTQDDITLSSPAVYEGKIYIASKDHYLYCLNAYDGSYIWSHDIGGTFSSPTVYNDKIYIGSWDGNLYCLNATTGSLIWNYTSFRIDTTPAIAYGNVYFGNNWPGIYCIDAETGNYKWSYMDDTMGWFDSSPAVADEKVYIGSFWEGKYNKLYCLDAFTGDSIWNYSFYSGVRSSPAIVNGKLYVGANDNNVYCFGTNYDIVYVDDNYNFSTPGWQVNHFDNIQDGIDAVGENGSVYVNNGIYYENIIINKTINLIGENRDSTIIDGSGIGYVVHLNNDGINICEFTIRNSGSLGNDSGIILRSDNNIIFNNNLSENRYGIYSNLTIIQEDSGWKSPSATGNIYNEWTNPSNAYSSDDQYTTAEGTYLEQDYYNFNFNIPSDAVIKGIELAIEGHGDGVGNYIKAKVYSASEGKWEDNNGWMVLGDNGIDAIATYGGSTELWGLSWLPSDFSNDNFQMIITTFSRPDKLYVDHIQIKVYYEIFDSQSNNSLIYHNNFVDNYQNAYDPCNNIWDNGYPSGGNYWDDYNDTDRDGDGIGDIHYDIPGGNNKDRYPLGFFNPIANFTYSANDLIVLFNASLSYDPDGTIENITWSFGDGTNDTGAVVNYTYYNYGTYNVTLTVTDNDGKTDSIYQIISLEDFILPEIIDNTHNIGYTGDSFTFNATILDVGGVSIACVEYWNETGIHTNISMTNVINDYWEKTITLDDNLDILFYVFSVCDTSDNWNVSTINSITVYDNDNPTIANVSASPMIQLVGGFVNISTIIVDNIVIDEVYLYIEFPDSSSENFSITQNKTGNIFFCNKTYHQIGVYNYHIWVNDTSNNVNISNDYFFEIINQPPNTPSNPDPYDGETEVDINHDLTWDCSDPDGDPLTYDVYFGTNSSPPLVSSGQNDTTYNPGIMSYETKYYWQIVAWDNHNASATGPIWNFITEPNYPPFFGVPNPNNGSINQLLSFTWSILINDPEGDNFDWNIDCSNGQTNSGNGDSNGTKTLALTGLSYSTSYTVWVNATDPAGSGKYTHAWFTFTTKANSPPYLGTPNPINGSTGQPLAFTWSIPIYEPDELIDWSIECSNGQYNSATNDNPGTKSLSLSDLFHLSTYIVWVNVTDGYASVHEWFTFTTKNNSAPSAPVITGPSSGKPGQELTFVFSAVDPDGDDVRFIIDWGDSTSDTTDFVESGIDKSASHIWSSEATYSITAKAEDEFGLIGPEATFQVTIPRNKEINISLLQFLHSQANLFLLLQKLLQQM